VDYPVTFPYNPRSAPFVCGLVLVAAFLVFSLFSGEWRISALVLGDVVGELLQGFVLVHSHEGRPHAAPPAVSIFALRLSNSSAPLEDEGEFSEAIRKYSSISQTYPFTQNALTATFKTAALYSNFNNPEMDLEKAIFWYRKILNSDFHTNEKKRAEHAIGLLEHLLALQDKKENMQQENSQLLSEKHQLLVENKNMSIVLTRRAKKIQSLESKVMTFFELI